MRDATPQEQANIRQADAQRRAAVSDQHAHDALRQREVEELDARIVGLMQDHARIDSADRVARTISQAEISRLQVIWDELATRDAAERVQAADRVEPGRIQPWTPGRATSATLAPKESGTAHIRRLRSMLTGIGTPVDEC